jgi:NH3-dependent NAD+ synthetase
MESNLEQNLEQNPSETERQIPYSGIKDFLENSEDGKKLLQSLSDNRVTRGIDTWKQNNLDKLVEEEIGKRFPPETEEKKETSRLGAETLRPRA